MLNWFQRKQKYDEKVSNGDWIIVEYVFYSIKMDCNLTFLFHFQFAEISPTLTCQHVKSIFLSTLKFRSKKTSVRRLPFVSVPQKSPNLLFANFSALCSRSGVHNNIPSNHLQEVNIVTVADRRNLRQTFIRNNRYHIGLNIVKKLLKINYKCCR